MPTMRKILRKKTNCKLYSGEKLWKRTPSGILPFAVSVCSSTVPRFCDDSKNERNEEQKKLLRQHNKLT